MKTENIDSRQIYACGHTYLKISFISTERGREEEREGEKHRGLKHQLVASHTPPTGDLASNPDMCPEWELN